ncbi:hypothetical protein MPER_12812 [Moniliophthora perniciosa FA553]|nr:hypothetical protein MPER_12812 [Moniliophthora perniciosa FA553]
MPDGNTIQPIHIQDMVNVGRTTYETCRNTYKKALEMQARLSTQPLLTEDERQFLDILRIMTAEEVVPLECSPQAPQYMAAFILKQPEYDFRYRTCKDKFNPGTART